MFATGIFQLSIKEIRPHSTRDVLCFLTFSLSVYSSALNFAAGFYFKVQLMLFVCVCQGERTVMTRNMMHYLKPVITVPQIP